MTEPLTFSNALVENPDIIFYNFIPPEWRNLTNNYDKRLSTTSRQLLSLIVSRLQIYQKINYRKNYNVNCNDPLPSCCNQLLTPLNP